jgi:hypothetical protein
MNPTPLPNQHSSINERMTVTMEEPFWVFLIGVRFDKPWKIHQWPP